MSEHNQKIIVDNVYKSFGSGNTRTEVLHGINWEIEPGKMTFLVGPSGCGKTTLISIIAGILSATDGDVTLFGSNINKMSGKENAKFRRENIGFIFQQFNLLPALSAAENVSVPLIANKINRKTALKKSKEMLKKVGLGEHTHKLPKSLSGGQQQRVAIARALVHEPRLLVCDEPTASLDAASGQQAMELLKANAQKEGRCVIIVTHDNRIFDFADTMVKMGDGNIKSIEDNYSKNINKDNNKERAE